MDAFHQIGEHECSSERKANMMRIIMFVVMVLLGSMRNHRDTNQQLVMSAATAGDELEEESTDTEKEVVDLWRRQLVRHPNGHLTHEEYKGYNRETERVLPDTFTTYDLFNHYIQALLEEEIPAGGSWAIRNYPIPNARRDAALAHERLREIFADLKEFGVTVAYLNKDSSFTAISIREADGSPRLWDPDNQDLSPTFEKIAISMGSKIMKRLASLGDPNHLVGDFTLVVVDDDEYHAPQEGVLFVKFVDLSDKFKVDGEFYGRPHVKNMLIEGMFKRIKDNDPRKAGALRKKMHHHSCFNARLLGSFGYVKGDLVEVAKDEYLNVDLLIDVTNRKSELAHTDRNTAILQMFPQEQSNEVRSDRQSIGLLYDWLYDQPTPDREDSVGLLQDALIDQVDEMIEMFHEGRLMYHVDSNRDENDTIRNVFLKLESWVAAGMSMNDSLFLLMQLAGQVIKMMHCRSGTDDKNRRYPIPYAKRVSMRSEFSAEMRYKTKAHLAWNEAYTDPYIGLIIPDSMFEIVAEVLGGADKDDHLYIQYRVAVDADDFFGIEPGDTVQIVTRLPMGMDSNGKEVGIEYWVFKCTEWEAQEVKETYGELPPVVMADRPKNVYEMQFPQPTFELTEPDDLPENYTKKHFVQKVEEATLSRGVYGQHFNLRLALAHYNIPFPHVAPEEDINDACLQIRKAEDLAHIRNVNKREKKLLIREMNKDDRGVDPWVIKRCGIEGKVRPEPGIYSKLVDFHKAQQGRLLKALKAHITAIKERLEEEHQDVQLTPVNGIDANTPELIHYTKIEEERFAEEHGEGKRTHWDFEEIGNRVVNRLEELVHEGVIDRDRMLRMFREAYAWIWTQVKRSKYHSETYRMFYDHDQQIMMGKMLDVLIEALQQEGE